MFRDRHTSVKGWCSDERAGWFVQGNFHAFPRTGAPISDPARFYERRPMRRVGDRRSKHLDYFEDSVALAGVMGNGFIVSGSRNGSSVNFPPVRSASFTG